MRNPDAYDPDDTDDGRPPLSASQVGRVSRRRYVRYVTALSFGEPEDDSPRVKPTLATVAWLSRPDVK
jgi:hypothetical protein